MRVFQKNGAVFATFVRAVCIFALKDAKAGRATFYPISSVSGQNPTQEMINAKKCKGYIGVADELITFKPEYKNIFSSLLGRTVIFDNI